MEEEQQDEEMDEIKQTSVKREHMLRDHLAGWKRAWNKLRMMSRGENFQ